MRMIPEFSRPYFAIDGDTIVGNELNNEVVYKLEGRRGTRFN